MTKGDPSANDSRLTRRAGRLVAFGVCATLTAAICAVSVYALGDDSRRGGISRWESQTDAAVFFWPGLSMGVVTVALLLGWTRRSRRPSRLALPERLLALTVVGLLVVSTLALMLITFVALVND